MSASKYTMGLNFISLAKKAVGFLNTHFHFSIAITKFLDWIWKGLINSLCGCEAVGVCTVGGGEGYGMGWIPVLQCLASYSTGPHVELPNILYFAFRFYFYLNYAA